MKILLLSDSNSPHTLRWAKSLSKMNIKIAIFSIHEPNLSLYDATPEILIYSLHASRDLQTKNEKNISKIIYFKAIYKIKNLIKEFQPDIVHSHYASSYGLIGALAGFQPYIISVWGGDVFGFPNYSILHRNFLKYALSKASIILSTSHIMKEETRKYTSKQIEVIPFGVDVELFKPNKVERIFNDEDIVIGTIKTLELRYGIEYLIRGFELVKNKFPDKSLKLLIAGEGTERARLEKLVKELKLTNDTIFTGYINHTEVQNFHNMIDIFVAVSLEESFGVAIIEASACEKPVVVSNVGGLPEVVDNGKTGYIVDSKNFNKLADALIKLISDSGLRLEMGKNGREKVKKEYEWNWCVHKMVSIYNQLLTK